MLLKSLENYQKKSLPNIKSKRDCFPTHTHIHRTYLNTKRRVSLSLLLKYHNFFTHEISSTFTNAYTQLYTIAVPLAHFPFSSEHAA